MLFPLRIFILWYQWLDVINTIVQYEVIDSQRKWLFSIEISNSVGQIGSTKCLIYRKHKNILEDTRALSLKREKQNVNNMTGFGLQN